MPSGSGSADRHLLEQAAEVADQEVLATFREVVHSVSASFPEMRMQHPQLSVRDFKLMVRVGLLELFAPDEFPTTKARAERLKFLPKDIEDLCQDVAYRRICEALRVSFEELASPKTYRAHLEDLKTQDRVFREQKRGAFHGRDEREKQRALAAFADRYAPVIKTTNQTNVVVIQGAELDGLDALEKRLEDKGHPIINVNARPALHEGTDSPGPDEG